MKTISFYIVPFILHAEILFVLQIINCKCKCPCKGSMMARKVMITCLEASQGLIWVGTNTGHILTIPVPVRINRNSLSTSCVYLSDDLC